ncbi:MAG TPA: hypothetical protein PK036_09380 [Geobacteraceae bacterium]|nr:hypothetical protein [Geobacteraceae bacterium]
MIYDDCEGYHFDKMRINCEPDNQTLYRELHKYGFFSECRDLRVFPSKLAAYKTRIEVVAPNAKFLEMLSLKKSIFGTYPIITYCEIAHDVFSLSDCDAMLEADKIFRTIRMKYFYGYIFEAEKAKKKKSLKQLVLDYKQRGLFAERTFYSVYENRREGTKTFRIKFVIYARLSKINWEPCVHCEWRITGTEKIKRLTGIRSIEDLASFDFRTFFEKMEHKYIVHEELDTKKISKVFSGMERRRILSMRERMKGALEYSMFRSYYGIETVSDFVHAVKKELKNSCGKRGPKTPWIKKIEKLKNINRFTRCL